MQYTQNESFGGNQHIEIQNAEEEEDDEDEEDQGIQEQQ
jgi:hypothetical protein